MIAAKIIEDVTAGLELFAQVAADLSANGAKDGQPTDGVEALLHDAE